MSNRIHITVNIIGFQIGWFACVFMAAQKTPSIGIAIALVIVGIYLVIIKDKLSSIFLLLNVMLVGTIWDSVLTNAGILVFDVGIFSPYFAPSWIIVMWLLFATTLNVSLRWLYDRYWLAMILGAIAGPLAYQAGAALGAVSIPNQVVANIVLLTGWAVLMPLLIFTAKTFDGTNQKQVSINDH